MLSFLSNTRVYLAAGATDLRKSFDTLAGVVRESLRLDPLSRHLFVFTNSRKNRINILLGQHRLVVVRQAPRGRDAGLAGIAKPLDRALERGVDLAVARGCETVASPIIVGK